ncbi:hypothetical protein [Amycolatopsis sp. SID8362]|uniref:hypothetical protein n=1 Tax=Amycolatopsis sp. SID8362 TaxID=2690346 RepID=UPI00136A9679|nr:hypothetical protein [Amycolatopsis sp. SID8362]NBH06082.1 hypothetical protein [Amycolatopsis sp. SID8362]NED42781.1 hypothetical protein [Amycolatopsis sp. SID8362]
MLSRLGHVVIIDDFVEDGRVGRRGIDSVSRKRLGELGGRFLPYRRGRSTSAGTASTVSISDEAGMAASAAAPTKSARYVGQPAAVPSQPT